MDHMNRRFFLQCVLFGGIGLLSFKQAIFAEEITEEVLTVSLYPKTDQEKAYLNEVIEQMNIGTIPKKIVYMSYRYTMKKKKSMRMIYFSKCLNQLCMQSGIKVSLPSF